MAEPRTEWGRELKAQTEELGKDVVHLREEIGSLTGSLEQCSQAVQSLIADLNDLRQAKALFATQLDTVSNEVDQLCHFQAETRIELAWIEWILGTPTMIMIALGIFLITSLQSLTATTSRMEEALCGHSIILERLQSSIKDKSG